MKHFYFLLSSKVVFTLALVCAGLYAYEGGKFYLATIFLHGMFFGIFYLSQANEEMRKKKMFKLTYICSSCRASFHTYQKSGVIKETAALCTCGKAAPLIGIEECIITTSSELYNKKTS
jgi:hypothetical protein